MGKFIKDKAQRESENKISKDEKIQLLKEIKSEIESGNISSSVSEVDKLIKHFETQGLFLFVLGLNVLVVLLTPLWGFSSITIINILVVVVFSVDMGLKASKATDLITLYKNGNMPKPLSKSSAVNNLSKADEIKKLNDLKAEGILTEEEFLEEKKKILAA